MATAKKFLPWKLRGELLLLFDVLPVAIEAWQSGADDVEIPNHVVATPTESVGSSLAAQRFDDVQVESVDRTLA